MGRQIFRFHIKHQGIYNFFTLFYTFFTFFLHFFTIILQTRNTPAPTPPPLPLRPPRGSASSQPRLTLPHASRPAPTPTRRPRSKPWLPAGLPNPYVPGHQAGTHTFSQTLAPFLHAIYTPPPHRTNYKMSVGSWQPRLWKATRLEPDARGAVIR